MDDALSIRAQEICAHLLLFPYIKRDRYRDLFLDDELRAMVAERLDGVGMQLAESFYSDFFAVRPIDRIESDIRFDWAANHRLPKGAVALLVVLWAKLVLPRRAARDRREDPSDPNLALFPDDKDTRDYVVKVPRDAILAEYQDRFGRVNILRYIGTLKRLGFIREDRAGRLYEGPLLELLVDGDRMAAEIRNGVLWEMLGSAPPQPAEVVPAQLDDVADGEGPELGPVDDDDDDDDDDDEDPYA